jgi:hypothetical protein
VTTSPGFSSRDSTTTVRQFPQRDEIQMSEMTPGWSNSGPDKPADEAKPITEADSKVVEPAAAESKTVRKSTRPRKKA